MGVMAHDRQIDKCAVDHLFDFHLDADHIMQELEADKAKKDVESLMQKNSDKRQKEWACEVREWWKDGSSSSSESGTWGGGNDRDCNRDRD